MARQKRENGAIAEGPKRRGRPPKDKSAKPAAPKVAKPTAVKSSEVSKMTSGAKLKELLSLARSTTADILEMSGALGNSIALAIEHNHLHRKAFGVIRQLDRLPAEKLADFLDHFSYYLNVSGLEKRAQTAPSFDLDNRALPADEDEEEGEQEENSENDNDNSGSGVRPFGASAGIDPNLRH